MVPLVEILLIVVCVWKWSEVDICFLSWHQLTGPPRWQPPQYSCIFWETSKSHQTNIVLHQLTFLWLPLFIRIKVKWVPVTADFGEGCWLSPLWCCTLGIYNGRRVSVAPWKMSREAEKHLPELYNAFAVLSSSDLIPVFLPSGGANLIFAGLCGRTFICHFRSFCQNHGTSAGNPASISEM